MIYDDLWLYVMIDGDSWLFKMIYDTFLLFIMGHDSPWRFMMIHDDVDDDHYNADSDSDDIYIMMQCLCVTKNDHFLLGVSCNHP